MADRMCPHMSAFDFIPKYVPLATLDVNAASEKIINAERR
jgi:hypothetical protein